MKTGTCRHCGNAIVRSDRYGTGRTWLAPDAPYPYTICPSRSGVDRNHTPYEQGCDEPPPACAPKVGDEVWLRGTVAETGSCMIVQVGTNKDCRVFCTPKSVVKVIPAADRVTLKGNPVADVRKELKQFEKQVVALTEELRDVGIEP